MEIQLKHLQKGSTVIMRYLWELVKTRMGVKQPCTLENFALLVTAQCNVIFQYCEKARQMGMLTGAEKNDRSYASSKNNLNSSITTTNKPSLNSQSVKKDDRFNRKNNTSNLSTVEKRSCNHCGNNHDTEYCKVSKRPDFSNLSKYYNTNATISYADSEQGKLNLAENPGRTKIWYGQQLYAESQIKRKNDHKDQDKDSKKPKSSFKGRNGGNSEFLEINNNVYRGLKNNVCADEILTNTCDKNNCTCNEDIENVNILLNTVPDQYLEASIVQVLLSHPSNNNNTFLCFALIDTGCISRLNYATLYLGEKC